MGKDDVKGTGWRKRAVAGQPQTTQQSDPTPPPIGQRAKMTRWFLPRALLRTAVRVLESTVFGRHADARVIEALAVPKVCPHDYSQEEDEQGDFWFDYVADCGDGWNSTYSVARVIAQPELDVCSDDESDASSTKRGRLLIFGGDAVYPTPSAADYKSRLESVYRTAFYNETNPPDVFAIPGNHDWYDSLVAFSRLFIAQRHFGPCKTHQKRSYFALKLPQDWWLFAVDIQLGSDIDAAQLHYFKEVASKLKEHSRVILCVAEPYWILRGLNKVGADEGNLVVLENNVLRHRVMAFVAGDLHHYVRHEGPGGVQKIICGGGGAFLHATHMPDNAEKLNGNFERKACYPEPAVSARLARRILLFPLFNPEFSIVPAIAYTLTYWASGFGFYHCGDHGIGNLLLCAAAKLLVDPLWIIWVAIMLSVCILFSDRTNTVFRLTAGAIHGLTHIVAALMTASLAFSLTGLSTPLQLSNPVGNGVLLALIIIFGAIAGSFLFGAYLFICQTFFGKEGETTFAGLRIQDWKSFLRFRIDRQGNLEIYAIGIKRVCRKWKEPQGSDDSTLDPASVKDRDTHPHLIEKLTLIPEPIMSLEKVKVCRVKTKSTQNNQ